MENASQDGPVSPFPCGENDVDALLRAAFKRQKEAAGTRKVRPFPVEPETPLVLGNFRLLREIGRGPAGIVYEAEEAAGGRRVALRVFPRHVTLRESLIARLRRVTARAAELEHPGISRPFLLGREGDVHYLATELAEGAPLDRMIRRLGKHDVTALTGRAIREAILGDRDDSHEEAVETDGGPWAGSFPVAAGGIVVQAARALGHAHGHGVIHGNIKPSNIVIHAGGDVKLTDLGLVHPADRAFLAPGTELLGTVHYTAPELLEDPRAEPDARSDLFSLGVILYELTTLERPFTGESTREVLENMRRGEPGDPCALNPRLPARLAAIILHALDKDPGLRYWTAEGLADDLQGILNH
jgi:serine/threonine protein kinase